MKVDSRRKIGVQYSVPSFGSACVAVFEALSMGICAKVCSFLFGPKAGEIVRE